MKHFIRFIICGCILTVNVALAHANLESSTPEDGSTVTGLETVNLTFTENVQIAFSFFKVYKLAEEGSLEDNQEKLRLNGLAGQLLSMISEEGDETERADAGLLTEGSSKTIELELKGDLAPGIYALMWRVLSVDTHVTQGFILFNYQPSQQ
jgi:copper resistance protein C